MEGLRNVNVQVALSKSVSSLGVSREGTHLILAGYGVFLVVVRGVYVW